AVLEAGSAAWSVLPSPRWGGGEGGGACNKIERTWGKIHVHTLTPSPNPPPQAGEGADRVRRLMRMLARASRYKRPATALQFFQQTLRWGHPRIDGSSFLTRCSTSLHSAGVSFTAPTNWVV